MKQARRTGRVTHTSHCHSLTTLHARHSALMSGRAKFVLCRHTSAYMTLHSCIPHMLDCSALHRSALSFTWYRRYLVGTSLWTYSSLLLPPPRRSPHTTLQTLTSHPHWRTFSPLSFGRRGYTLIANHYMVLRHLVLHYIIPHYMVPYCMALHCMILHYLFLHDTGSVVHGLPPMALHNMVQHHVSQSGFTLPGPALPRAVLLCTALRLTALHSATLCFISPRRTGPHSAP
jgi:hypothetical protein